LFHAKITQGGGVATFRLTAYGWRVEVCRRGVRKSASAFKTKAAAVAWAGRVESEIMAGVRGEIPNLTVHELLERYKKEVSEGKKGRRWEVIRLEALQRDRLAQVRLRQLDSPHASDWQQRRLQAVSAASVRRERNLLNNVFQIAVKEWKWLTKNPFEGIRRPKDSRGRERIATPAEIKSLTATDGTLSRVVTIALETGMRASEIPAAQVTGRVARLEDSKNGEVRLIPLSLKAVEALADGINLTPGSISALFARKCGELKIEGLTFHDLRHTACTRLAKKLNLLELCKMMGWKDPRHALRYYNEPISNIAKKL
jgi:integrase